MSTNTEITDHRSTALNEALKIMAEGEPNAGGAHRDYKIRIGESHDTYIRFQEGNPALEINGISNESLLAIVMHRLRGVQGENPGQVKADAKFQHINNHLALRLIEEAMNQLHARSTERMARGVEGTQAV